MRGRTGARLRVWAAVLSALALNLTHAAGASAPPGAVEPCRLSGIEREMRCGGIDAAEDPAQPQGRRIRIAYAILPAVARNKYSDPIFVLAGGPGQSARGIAAQIAPVFSNLNKRRDIVFVDQRGTGASNGLECKLDPRAPLSATVDPAALAERLRECWKGLPGDTRHYTTPIAMRDLDAVRAALGVEQLNLWGASYGTRAALEYLRQFPRRVRTLTLDGVAPATMALPASFAVDSDAALREVLQACRRAADCHRRYGAALDGFEPWLARLANAPLHATVTHPTTGIAEQVRIERDTILSALRVPLYAPVLSSTLPYAIEQAQLGNYGPVMAMASLMNNTVNEHFSYGMHLAVVCAEDLPRIRPEDEAIAQRTLFGRFFIEHYRSLCRGWPVGELAPAFYEPVRSDVPTLIFSGGLDPATPRRHAEAAMRSLTRVRHVLAPHASHGVSSVPCAAGLIEQLVKNGSIDGIDGRCLAQMPRPPFFRPFTSGGGT
jgi:pimeloyl-ACP methyl ester carboxylesterase